MKCPQLLNSLVLLQFVIVTFAVDEEIERRRTSNVCRVTTDCPSNAHCEPRSGGWDGQCVCRDGFFMNSDGKERRCTEIADFGELCYLNRQCEFRLGVSAECRNGQCSCKDGSHYVVNDNACFNSSNIGEYCRLTSNCVVEHTTCIKSECLCPYDHHPDHKRSRCLKSIELNESCSIHDECIAENSICYRTCKCRAGHVVSEDGQRCLPLATSLYQKCQENLQCCQITNSFCGSNNTCICLPDRHDVNARCQVSVRLGEACESDDNCVIAHSSCIDRRCRCEQGFQEFQGRFCSNAENVQISIIGLLLVQIVRLL